MRTMGKSMPNDEPGVGEDVVCRSRQRNTFGPTGDYSASEDTERAHFKYSGNDSDIIACLISRMMSRYRWMLCLVASTANNISPDWNKWRR